MTYCTLRSSLTGQPPLTIPEIALRLGVHPAYFQNGIKVYELSRLPTDKELYLAGHTHIGPSASSVESSGPANSPANPPPDNSLKAGIDSVAVAWEGENAILARVDPVNPPPTKEDRNYIWRFDGGSHADEEVFLPGQGAPQWDVDLRNIELRQIALVPPGGALRIPSDEELTGQGQENRGGESSVTAVVAAAIGLSVVALTSEESTGHHDLIHESTAYHEPLQETTAHHDPGQHGLEHYSHLGVDQSHMGGHDALQSEQDAVQMASDYLQSETTADETILGNMHG